MITIQRQPKGNGAYETRGWETPPIPKKTYAGVRADEAGKSMDALRDGGRCRVQRK